MPESAPAATARALSFNVKGGRCEACQGDGVIKVEMHFLPDIYVPPAMSARANATTAKPEVKYKGKSITTKPSR